MLEATEVLELIQIDHTLADVVIVDSVYQRSNGRPWLSLAIDVATRSVLGFHLAPVRAILLRDLEGMPDDEQVVRVLQRLYLPKTSARHRISQ